MYLIELHHCIFPIENVLEIRKAFFFWSKDVKELHNYKEFIKINYIMKKKNEWH